jgi:hypothetical protein
MCRCHPHTACSHSRTLHTYLVYVHIRYLLWQGASAARTDRCSGINQTRCGRHLGAHDAVGHSHSSPQSSSMARWGFAAAAGGRCVSQVGPRCRMISTQQMDPSTPHVAAKAVPPVTGATGENYRHLVSCCRQAATAPEGLQRTLAMRYAGRLAHVAASGKPPPCAVCAALTRMVQNHQPTGSAVCLGITTEHLVPSLRSGVKLAAAEGLPGGEALLLQHLDMCCAGLRADRAAMIAGAAADAASSTGAAGSRATGVQAPRSSQTPRPGGPAATWQPQALSRTSRSGR